MALELRHAAIHEAAHAVVLWLVGWGDDLKWLQMRRVDGGAELARMKFDRRTAEGVSSIRSTLVVLFAGSAASSEHFGTFMRDIDEDWCEAKHAIASYFAPRKVAMRIDSRIGCLDPEADDLVADSLKQANAIVRYDPVKTAIHAVAELLLGVAPDQEGLCVLPGADVISLGRVRNLVSASRNW